MPPFLDSPYIQKDSNRDVLTSCQESILLVVVCFIMTACSEGEFSCQGKRCYKGIMGRLLRRDLTGKLQVSKAIVVISGCMKEYLLFKIDKSEVGR